MEEEIATVENSEVQMRWNTRIIQIVSPPSQNSVISQHNTNNPKNEAKNEPIPKSIHYLFA